MNKNDFVLFMEAVINCTTQTDKKTEKIQIIVKTTDLGIMGLCGRQLRKCWVVEILAHSQEEAVHCGPKYSAVGCLKSYC